MESERSLPTVILPPSFARREVSPPVGVCISLDRKSYFPTIETEDGEVSPHGFLEWLVGKNVFVSVRQRGLFDSVLRGLPSDVLASLALAGRASFRDFVLYLYGRDGCLSVRRGNAWGSLANVDKLCPQVQSPRGVRLAVELAMARMRRYGFPDIDFRSVGRVAQDIFLRHCRFQPRPPGKHLWRHLQSFKGARMEGVVFGSSEVYDYDIRSAFPSFVAGLVGTRGMKWSESTSYDPEAIYGAARCDVYVNERLLRGPIAVRDGESSLYFPVGELSNVWVCKPELDLLYEYPELGRVVRIHEASWGLGGYGVRPYRRLLKYLFDLRGSDEFLSPYLKFVMAALWGKFISSYPVVKDLETGEGWMQSGPLYNPVFGSHVTSAMRCHLYRLSLGLDVVGEFIDGVSVPKPLKGDGFGGGLGSIVEKGHGRMVLFSDSVKGCEWKNPEVLEIAASQASERKLELPMEYLHTLKSAVQRFGSLRAGSQIGRLFSTTQLVRLGSSMRFMGEDALRVGDFLEGRVQSWPPKMGEVRFFKFVKGSDLFESPFLTDVNEALLLQEIDGR